MESDKYIQEVLAMLRAEKKKQHLSCEEIEKLTIDKGIAVHLKTIRRVMRPDGDDTNFRLSTLRNIAVAMGLDLLNQDANEELARERVKIETELAVLQAEKAHFEKTMQEKDELIRKYEDTLHGLVEQINSMRHRMENGEKLLENRGEHITRLMNHAAEQRKTTQRKDFFLHLYAVSTLSVSILLILLFAFNVLVLQL